ncbi:MAG TPA: methyl-accepting chemotaxis protein [Spirochaetota bacterium]|nr:methyl-accepting chemotaxis protein [Spirochaetota bacterium]HPD77639.1 methyl-accepting chemotaxis protein [Spirochaetota bacterium]HPX90426.1 methyl-accepting chemotaxis protein [Spirochaetota bacterium]
MNVHSFKNKLILYISSIVVFLLVATSVVFLIATYYSINKEINEKMPLKLSFVKSEIEKKLNDHAVIVRSIASLAQSNKGSISRQVYIDFLRDLNKDNNSSFGFGVWFEPYRYSPTIKYFGPYVYKDKGNIIATLEYEKASYDFHNQDWYKTGIGKEENTVAWSHPFYDDATKVTMVSAVSPFYDDNKKFMGVASGDFDIAELQKMVNSLRDETIDLKGFLLDSDGTFITFYDNEFIMKKKITQHPESGFALLGKDILKNKNGSGEAELNSTPILVYYSTIEQTGWILCVTVSKSLLYAPVRRLAFVTILILIFSVVLSVAVSYYIAGKISNPVKAMSDFADKIADGNFTERIDIKQKDEIGNLARALNTSADNLEDLISKIIISAENLNSAVEEISKGNINLSQRTTEQASALEEIAATIEENTATVEKNAENSQHAEKLTKEGADKSSLGSQQADIAIKAINAINESSKKIAEIISVINEIAFQTNLLALNAAVEAARAGEQGRGFAVVASEVRNLAQRSGAAAKEIEQLIRESVSRVDEGTELVIKTGQFLKDIAEAAKLSANIISEIAAASDEQRTGMEQINKAVMELDSMTQQNAALVEETASASEEMANQAQELLALVSRFKISSDHYDKDKSVKKSFALRVNQQRESQNKKEEASQNKTRNSYIAENKTSDGKSELSDIMSDEGFERF